MRTASLFFALFLRFSVPGRFSPLFYGFHGLTASQIGGLLSCCNLLTLIANPLLSFKSDASGDRHYVVAVSQTISLAFFMLQPLAMGTAPFVTILICFAALSGAFMRSSYPILSAIAFDRLAGVHGRDWAPLYFGSVRLWGGVGWAVGSSMLGMILDVVNQWVGNQNRDKKGVDLPLLTVFYVLAPVIVACLVITVFYDRRVSRGGMKKSIGSGEGEGDDDKNLYGNEGRTVVTRSNSNSTYVNLNVSADGDGAGDLIQQREQVVVQNSRVKINSNSNSEMTDNNNNSNRSEMLVDLMSSATTQMNNLATNISTTTTATNRRSSSSSPDADAPGPDNLLHALRPVLCTGGAWMACFFLLLFSLGIGMSIVESLLFVFYRNDLEASYTLCGLSVIITVASEAPLFARAEYMLRLCGPPRLLMLGACAYVLRMVGYSLVRPHAAMSHAAIGAVIALEPLHGVTFAFVHASAVAIVAARAPQRYAATAQSVVQLVADAASVVGVLVGGYVIQLLGDSRGLYRACAIGVGAATLAFAIVVRVCPQRFERYEGEGVVKEGKQRM